MTTTSCLRLKKWIDEVAELTKPKEVYWCNGSDEEYQTFAEKMLADGSFIKLNEKTYPNCYLHRSDPTDVARVEHLTFVCTPTKDDAGPNNNWMLPADGHKKMDGLFSGAMAGRTMYVVPYCMGPIDSPLSRCGVEITDSPYVVENMKIMTRMGAAALARIEKEESFVKGLHSVGDLDPERRFIMHFPEERVIKSYGSGYGGNALLGKKCHALRIASYQARQEGWLAEHMLIVGIKAPNKEIKYVAAAFPSACGKTNLAMLIPPESMKGYEVFTVGDDIAWLHLRDDGQLWAINPEAGYFGVAPGTGPETNPTALNMLRSDTIFTNVGLTKENEPWWEGMTKVAPAAGMIDWKGQPYNPAKGPAAHPNSRFTVSAKQCASYSPHAEDASGVPISAIIFGGRRRSLAPLVLESKNWTHGVLMGATIGSETTAAATGTVGVIRRDPMAMKPFCGYNFADYWGHWLSFDKKSKKLPKIFQVNWFRKSEQGKFLWPGFGDNLRVIEWILSRCDGTASKYQDTAVGYLPREEDLNLAGLDLPKENLEELLQIDRDEWRDEFKETDKYLSTYGDRLPSSLKKTHHEIASKL